MGEPVNSGMNSETPTPNPSGNASGNASGNSGGGSSGGILSRTVARWGLLLTAAAVLVVLNLLSAIWFVRGDLTEDSEFTVSSSTRNLLKQLDDRLVVRAYFTRNLPPPYSRVRGHVQDLLQEYRTLSGGRVAFEFVDPAETMGEGAEHEMNLMGIPLVQVTDVSSDKVEVKNGFMGVVIQFGDQREVLPVVRSTQGLEYLFTGKIRKLTGTGRGKIGLVPAPGTLDPKSDMAQVMRVIEEQYQVEPVPLEAGEEVPPGIKVLLVARPLEEMSRWTLAQLDRHLVSGGGLGVFFGRTEVELQSQYTRILSDPFRSLLDKWGVTVGDDMVVDRHNVRITVAQQRGFFTMQNLVDYPYIPSLRDLDTQHPVVSGLEGIFLPFASSLAVHEVPGVTYTVLARSSADSWRLAPGYDIDPFKPLEKLLNEQSVRGPHPLAVAAKGTFPSAMAGFTVERPRLGADGNIEAGGKVTLPAPPSAPGRLIVVGTGTLLEDKYMMSGENLPFIMNAVDWLAGDEALLSLRSRGVTDRPLAELGPGGRALAKFVCVLLGPLLLVAAGLVHWRLRSARRRRLADLLREDTRR